MSYIYPPGTFPRHRYYNPYSYYGYGYRPYPYYPQNNFIGNQYSNINQSLINSGSMTGVNQIANSNNIRY